MQIHKYLLSLKVPINNQSSEIKIPGYCFKSFENLYSHYVPFIIPYLLLLALHICFYFFNQVDFFFIILRRPSKLRVGISLITYQLGEHFSAYIRVIVLLFICFHNRLMMFLLLLLHLSCLLQGACLVVSFDIIIRRLDLFSSPFRIIGSAAFNIFLSLVFFFKNSFQELNFAPKVVLFVHSDLAPGHVLWQTLVTSLYLLLVPRPSSFS